jgi:hypothetical protein
VEQTKEIIKNLNKERQKRMDEIMHSKTADVASHHK